MEYIEVNPLPLVCQECEAAQERYKTATAEEKAKIEEEYYFDCGVCDHALERWHLSQADELRLKKKGLEKAIERYQRQIAEIERQLEGMTNGTN